MGDSVSAKVHIPGSEADKTRRGPNRQLTYDIVCQWIRLQGMDEYTTNGLIEMASKIPTSALHHFRKNFNLMIARVRQARNEEQRGFQESK